MPIPQAADFDPVLSFTTTMISYTPVNVTPGRLAAGDGYVIAGKVNGYAAPAGLSTAQCTFTDTRGPVLRVCTVDYAPIFASFIGRNGGLRETRVDRCSSRWSLKAPGSRCE